MIRGSDSLQGDWKQGLVRSLFCCGHSMKAAIAGIAAMIGLAVSLASCIPAADGARTINLNVGDNWHFFRGATDPPAGWQKADFDDSSWERGPSGFGYGESDRIMTRLSDMKGAYTTVYVRQEFFVDSSDRITRLTLSLVCDGPFIAYLNGIEALRSKKPQRGEPLDLIGFAHELDQPVNAIGVQCSNDDINSDDFLFIPSFHYHED